MKEKICLLILLGLLACENVEPPLSARRITSRSELLGGPKQFGDVGDFLLENAQIKAVILDAGHFVSPALWGGALVDIDLNRTWRDLRGGNGLDQFFLLLPMVNIAVPHPEKGQVESLQTDLLADIRVTGRGDHVLALLNLMDLAAPLGIISRFVIRTDYIVHRDTSFIKIVTTFRPILETDCKNNSDDDGDGKSDCDDSDCSLDPACPDFCDRMKCPPDTKCDPFWAECLTPCDKDGQCPDGKECDLATSLCVGKTVNMRDLKLGTDLTDVLSGGLLKLLTGEIQEIEKKPGFIAGDMTLFGANLFSFAPGIGFEIDAQYRLMFIRGRNALLNPLAFDFMAGTGDRVSYAYFTLTGAVLFPFATESLTGSITHGLNCLISPEDDKECDDIPFVRYTRFVAVGEGDVASTLETIYALRNTPHGRIEGQVIDQKTGKPISNADIFAISDPCDPKNCNQVIQDCGSFDSYEELSKAARYCTKTDDNPDGIAMIESHFRSDRGLTIHPSGHFSGPLKPGVYYLVARKGKGPLSKVTKIEVKEGKTTHCSLMIPEGGKLRYRVVDENGQPIFARVTIGHCFPECSVDSDCKDGEKCDADFQCRPPNCQTNSDCDYDEICEGGKCICKKEKMAGEPREELGDAYLSDRKVMVDFANGGYGEVVLPPGKYDVIFSHGIEYDVDRREIEIKQGLETFIDAICKRVIDTRGWISIDQHMHSSGSPDSGTPLDMRIVSAMSDGLEIMVMTDHDYISDPMPIINQKGWKTFVKGFTGEEISTLDISHIIGWPLRFTTKESNHGAMNWVSKTAREVFSWIRAHGALSPEDTLVVIPHPRGGITSYFDVFALNPFTLNLEPGMIQKSTTLLDPSNFAQEYDLIEIMNSKRLDIERIPTYAEVRDYNKIQRKLLKNLRNSPREEIVSQMTPPSWDIVRRTLMRTPDEHKSIWSFQGGIGCEIPPDCDEDKDCKGGKKCVDHLCLQSCNVEKDCPNGYECKQGYCELPDNLPCEAVKGLTDDWLRMIDRGIFKPGVGGSDVHGLANYEIGSLRNYVRYKDDDPVAIDSRSLISAYRQGRSFATYGPFIDFTIDGKGPGEIASMNGRNSLKMKLRVQSPLWYDVSRVEVYRNGNLEYIFDADANKPEFKIDVPNTKIENVNVEFEISPKEDSWYIVMAMGIKGRAMNPVYGSNELPPIYLGDLFVGVFGSLPIPLPSYVVSPKIPFFYAQFPFAVTNPIFVDVDGLDAMGCSFTPPSLPLPDWACNYPKDYPKERMPCQCR